MLLVQNNHGCNCNCIQMFPSVTWQRGNKRSSSDLVMSGDKDSNLQHLGTLWAM